MMMNKNTVLYIIAFSVGIFILIFISSRPTNEKIGRAEQNRKTRNALQEIIDSTNNEHPIFNNNLKGKTIVINIWATWCGPCIKEIPELNKLVKEFSSENVVFIAIDELDSTYEIKTMKKKNIEFDYQLLFEEEKLTEQIHSFKLPYESNGIPLNVVINQEGKIAVFYIGNDSVEFQKMREYLASTLNNNSK